MQVIPPVGATLAVTLLSGCAPTTVDLEAEGEALKQVSRDWSARVATGDLEAILAGWADDAVMMPPGLPPVEGKAAIRGYVEEAMKVPGFGISWEPVTVYVAPSGDLAYMIERNTTTFNDSTGTPVTVYGKAVTIWRREPDGTWLNVVDIWNGAPPPGFGANRSSNGEPHASSAPGRLGGPQRRALLAHGAPALP